METLPWHIRRVVVGFEEEGELNHEDAKDAKEREEDAQRWWEEGNRKFDAGDYTGAIEFYDKAVEFKPDYYEAWYNRGIALDDLGRYEDAITSYDKAVAIKPDCHEAWYNRGNALDDLGRYEEAITSYDKAVAIKPDCHEAWNRKGVVLCDNLQNCKEAIASFDKAIEFKPDYYEAWYNRGVALGNLGRCEEAIASYDKAVAIKPDYQNAWYNRGVALGSLGRHEDAIASYDKAVAIKPDDHEAWIGRGIAAVNSRSYDPFLSFMSKVARQNPHLKQRGYEGALTSFEEGLKYCPQDTHPEGWGKLHHAMGNAHYSKGLSASHPRSYRNKAANSYNQALITLTATDFPEQHLEVLRDLIRVRLDLGDTAKAEELQRRGTDVLRRLLDECKSPAKKRLLGLEFASFQQLTVDIAVQSGKCYGALELGEKGKNACLSWLLDDGGEVFISPNWQKIQQLLNPTTAIVYWHLSPAALHTFILKHETSSPIMLGKTLQVVIRHHTSSPILWEATKFVNPAQRLHKFENWLEKWNKQYANYRQSKDKTAKENNNWRNNLPKLLEELAKILNISTIIQSIQSIQNPKSKIQNLILVPHRDLHRLPLHALFPDNFTITYLPSAQIGLSLAELSPRQHTNSPSKLLSVEHPNSTASEDKPFPPLPVTAVSQAERLTRR